MKNSVWPQDWKRSVFIPIPKKGNAKEHSDYYTIALISHASKLMFKILQARLQQYVNQEIPVADFIFLGSKITVDGGCSHEIKKTLAPWKKNYDNPKQFI